MSILCRNLPLTAVLLLACAARPTFAQGAKPSVKIVGLRIVAAPLDDDGMLSAFHQQAGTSLALLAQQPGGGLISFDEKASEIASFTDDTGTNLLGDHDTTFTVFGPMASISKDAKSALVEINGLGLPSRGAKVFHARGALRFKHATKTKTAKIENVALKAETKFEAGPFKFVVSQVGKPDWGDSAIEVTLTTKQNTDAVREVRFLDGDGNTVESEDLGSGYMGFGDDFTYHLAFGLSKAAETATIEVEYWDDLEVVTIPFDLKTGLGLGT